MRAAGRLIILIWALAPGGLFCRNANEISLVFGGDVMLGRGVRTAMDQGLYKNPFEKIVPILSKTDFSMANLEMALDENCKPIEKKYSLYGGSAAQAVLSGSGLKAVSLANNHSIDCGCEGFEHTAEMVSQAGLLAVGEGLKIFKVKGTRLGIMGFVDTGFEGDQLARTCKPSIFFSPAALTQVGEAKKQVDVLVVMMHWGDETEKTPSSRQKLVAHELADAGADIIIGSGPHFLQVSEEYNKALIAYSLGNLVFDQEGSGSKGALLKIRIKGGKMDSHQLIPVKINQGRTEAQISQ
jgi:poly-gamma-glutamate synthesis protein (capsule biosynthesis protein)